MFIDDIFYCFVLLFCSKCGSSNYERASMLLVCIVILVVGLQCWCSNFDNMQFYDIFVRKCPVMPLFIVFFGRDLIPVNRKPYQQSHQKSQVERHHLMHRSSHSVYLCTPRTQWKDLKRKKDKENVQSRTGYLPKLLMLSDLSQILLVG